MQPFVTIGQGKVSNKQQQGKIMVHVANSEDPFLQHLDREIKKAKNLPGWESWSFHECLQDEFECDLKDVGKLSEATSTEGEAQNMLMALDKWLKKNSTPLSIELRYCLLALTQMLAFRFIPQNSLAPHVTKATQIDDLRLIERDAAVVGASIVRNCPLHLRTSGSYHGMQASNLIEGFAALEYGFKSAEQVTKEELEKAKLDSIRIEIDVAGHLTDDIQNLDRRWQQVQKYKIPPRLKTTQNLIEYQKKQGLSFLVLLTENQSLQISPEALKCLRDDYQINPICYGKQIENEIETDISSYVINPILLKLLLEPEEPPMSNSSVFISYAQKDKKWLEALQTQLGVLQMQEKLSIWADTKIATGDDWLPEIEKAMKSAQIAVMLISANFLNSSFINKKEIPTLLKRRKEEGLKVLPILVSECTWDRVDWIESKQMRQTKQPLDSLSKPAGNKALANFAREIDDILKFIKSAT